MNNLCTLLLTIIWLRCCFATRNNTCGAPSIINSIQPLLNVFSDSGLETKFNFTFHGNCSSTVPFAQFLALHSLYNSTNGKYWTWRNSSRIRWDFTNWNISHYPNPCDNWQGIFCRSSTNHTVSDRSRYCNISAILLGERNLKGSIPDSLSNLVGLEALNLPYNSITGFLPTQIGTLTNLFLLNLYNNSISGSIVSELGLLSQLIFLNLGQNRFRSSIPSELGNLVNLVELYLYNNALTGQLPSQLSYLHQLKDLSVSSNQLSGTVPSELFELTKLSNLKLNTNNFRGSISPLLGKLTGLMYLYMYDNQLEGSLPEAIASLTGLVYLCLNNNLLTGTLPSQLGRLKNLENLLLFQNELSGTIPITFANLTRLQNALLQDNQFSGPLDQVFSQTQSCLSVLVLSENSFSGTLPAGIFLLPNLRTLALMKNNFHGSLPSEICNASSTLQVLSLDGLAASAESLVVTFFSALHANTMLGTIPSCIFGLPGLVNLTMSANAFTGSLSSTAISPNMSILVLSNNKLTGIIPQAFQQFPFQQLDLSYNRIKGDIFSMTDFFDQRLCASSDGGPPNICYASLTLKVNRLSGIFPSTFEQASNIDIITGNLFDCYKASALPVNDVGSQNASCGTQTLNLFSAIYAGMLVVVVCCVAYLRRKFVVSDDMGAEDKVRSRLDYLAAFVYSVKNMVDSCENELGRTDFKESYMFSVVMMRVVRQLSLFFCCLIQVMYLPFYLGLKLGPNPNNNPASTHTFQYAWLPSLAFLEGTESSIIYGSLFAVLVSTVYFSVGVVATKELDIPERSFRTILAEKNSSEVIKLKIVLFFVLPLSNFVVMFFANFGYLYVQFSSVTSRYVDIFVGVLLVAFKLFWNMVILTILIKWILRAFRQYLPPAMNYESSSVVLQTAMLLLNNFIAPNIANMVTSPNCLFTLIQPPSNVTVAISYPLCTFVDVLGSCLQQTTFSTTTSLTPPFIYSDQCTSFLLVEYVPIFMAMAAYTAGLSPILFLLLSHLCDRFGSNESSDADPWFVKDLFKLVPKVFFRIPRILTSARNQRHLIQTKSYGQMSGDVVLFNAGNVAAGLASNLVILITFGAAYPPLAVMLTIAIWVDTLQWQAVIGRFLTRCNENRETMINISHESLQFSVVDQLHMGHHTHQSGLGEVIALEKRTYLISMLEKNCIGVSRIFRGAVWPMMMCTSGFTSFFLFDMIRSKQVTVAVLLSPLVFAVPIFWHFARDFFSVKLIDRWHSVTQWLEGSAGAMSTKPAADDSNQSPEGRAASREAGWASESYSEYKGDDGTEAGEPNRSGGECELSSSSRSSCTHGGSLTSLEIEAAFGGSASPTANPLVGGAAGGLLGSPHVRDWHTTSEAKGEGGDGGEGGEDWMVRDSYADMIIPQT